ncbi:hypothetical protein C0995_000360 [Termitomyces sp. Mi166|nr:hypothetical protein C0995_000360 [Termitomyces sp. Mi166\
MLNHGIEAGTIENEKGHDPAYFAYLQHLEEVSIEPVPHQKHCSADDPMAQWLPKRNRFIKELLTLEGRGHNALKNFEMLSYALKTIWGPRSLSKLALDSPPMVISSNDEESWTWTQFKGSCGRHHKRQVCSSMPCMPTTSHLYALFLGIDANFWLQRKHVSNDKQDPDLDQGFAYFVEEKAYKAYLKEHENDVEPKSTSCHDAVNHVFLIFDEKIYIKFMVLKFHLLAHFLLNYTIHVGQTDGEAPEHGWAEVNPLASSTKEMGPGSQCDCLDAHFGDYNWCKVVGMATLPSSTIKEWTTEVEAWENSNENNTNMEEEWEKPINPYDHKVEAAVWQKLANDEAADISSGKEFALDVNVTPSVLISAGLDLKAEQ